LARFFSARYGGFEHVLMAFQMLIVRMETVNDQIFPENYNSRRADYRWFKFHDDDFLR
jgi:hypothetical protein